MGSGGRVAAGVVGVLAGVAAATASREALLTLGASRAEARRELPGDDIVVEPDVQATRAITIEAPPAQVWPWLAQMGHGRAGWYGFDAYDNAGRASAEELRADIRPLAIGDRVDDATGPFSFVVADLKEERFLAFRATIHPVTGRPIPPAALDPTASGYAAAFLDFSWTFVLLPEGEDMTRLLVRVRYRRSRGAWLAVMLEGYELVDTLFTWRMLRGIEQRAEGELSNPVT